MWFEKARSEEAGLACVHAYLPSAYALEGERERAAAELAEARRPNGDLYSSIAQLKGGGSRVVPKIRAP